MADIKQTTPSGAVLYKFYPTEDFFCEDMKSQYVKGMEYYVREGNKKLADKVTEWVEQDKVMRG